MSMNSDNPFTQRCLPPKMMKYSAKTRRSDTAPTARQVKQRIEILEEQCAWRREWGSEFDEEAWQ